MRTTRTNITLILISLIAGVILLSAFYQYRTQREVIFEWARDKAAAEVRLLSNDISTVLSEITKDLFMLRDIPQISSLLDAVDIFDRKYALTEIEKIFLVFAQNKQIYDQVRFIDERGMELVRVNLYSNKAEVVKRGGLQDKRGRYYFKKSIELDYGEVYVSPMDLNIEHDVIETPYKPMIRYSTPVFDKRGRKRGVIVLNVKADYILSIIKEHQKRARYGEKYYLLNKDGYYLLHPDKKKEWGFMFGKDERILNDIPPLASLVKGQYQGFKPIYDQSLKKQYFYVYQRVYPITHKTVYQTGATSQKINDTGDANIHWVLLSSMDMQALVPALRKHTSGILLFSAALLAASVVIASILAWRHSRPIQMLSNTASKIAAGDLSVRVNISRQNEIGRLGAIFNEMTEALQKRQEQEKVFQRRLREEIVLAQEQERRVLAQDIHDQLGHNLAIMKMKIEDALRRLPKNIDNVAPPLEESTVLLREMIQQTRTLIFDLYPVMLDDFGLLRTIERHVKEFQTRTAIETRFIKEGFPGEPSRSVSIYVLRVIKELLNNTLKHSGANEVRVTIYGTDSRLGVSIADNGKGFNTDNVFISPHELKGIGLYSIKEWVSGLKGMFSIESKPGAGTRVIFEIPIEKAVGSETEKD